MLRNCNRKAEDQEFKYFHFFVSSLLCIVMGSCNFCYWFINIESFVL